MRKPPFILAVLLLLLFLAGPRLVGAQADGPAAGSSASGKTSAPPDLGTDWSGSIDLEGTANPLGVRLSAGVDYENAYRYSTEYDMVSAIWKTGGELFITPAYLQPSVHFEWMPVLPLTVNFQYDGYWFYGTNEGLLSFPSGQVPFGDDVRRAREGTEETGFARRFLLQPTLQLKSGSVIMRNQSDFAWYRFSGTGPYFLELEYDTLLKRSDRLTANRTQLLFETAGAGKRSTLAGPYFEFVHADSASLASRRVGVLFYTEQGPEVPWLRETRYFAELAYYLSDPNRSHGIFLLLGIGGDFGGK